MERRAESGSPSPEEQEARVGIEQPAAPPEADETVRRKKPLSLPDLPWFHDEEAACAFLERVLWADAIICPHCGVAGPAGARKQRNKPSLKHPEGKRRYGVRQCRSCKVLFTIRIGTVFENSRLPFHKILAAIYLMTTSEKRVYAHQLHIALQTSNATSRYLVDRVREGLKLRQVFPFSSDGMTMLRPIATESSTGK